MTESMKVNLTKTLTSLRIMSTIAGALITCFFVYMSIDNRMDKLELEQSSFKGVMDERTRNTATRVDDIYAIVSAWEPKQEHN